MGIVFKNGQAAVLLWVIFTLSSSLLQLRALQKKLSLPLRIFSVNLTKSEVSCRFGHIY